MQGSNPLPSKKKIAFGDLKMLDLIYSGPFLKSNL